MPRGIPNAKKDETGLRFTSFHVPLGLNPKSTGSTYIKTDLNTLWARNAARRAKEPATALEGRRGSDVIVIHPGSRFTRIGRACDINPVTVSSVVARKLRGGGTVPEPRYVPGIERPQPGMERTKPVQGSGGGDEYSVSSQSNDPFEVKIESLVKSFRERMKFYNLRINRDAAFVVSRFNGSFKPEVIPDAADPRKIDWITEADEDVLVGEKALRLADPHKTGYVVRWPLYGGHFNARGYPSHQLVLSDVEEILRETLNGSLSIDPKSYEDYSVVLIIPDIYERTYVKDLIDILLVKMGFKQICESLATTYGAGISTACVVNIGAAVTSIACVEDGLVVPDTRILLNIGGNDITEFLYVLLERIGFPYRDLDLARSYDWNVVEDLKARSATLDEGDVALDLYEFVVRRPDAPTKKYGLRAYDEVILAPMVLFEPKVVDFDSKLAGIHRQNSDVTDEISDVYPADRFTQAMVISTQHLVPQEPAKTKPSTTASDPNPQPGSITNAPSVADGAEPAPSTSAPSPASGDTTKADEEAPGGDTEAGAEEAAPTPMDVDKEKPEDESKSKTPVPGNQPAQQQQAAQQPQQPQQTGQGPTPASQQTSKESAAPQIDLFLEASKLPLDVAIFNSTRAAGGDDKIRKYLQAILVVGGTALMPGLEDALKSRLQAIATPLVQDMGAVGIIPSQKDVDERVLTWKGASVLGRMEGVTDMWVTGADWNTFGMRAVKERCFLL
ncbi:actin-like ATPase domain-containing protein [Thelephora terrestris]|uniref:Actin-like ATPase domain-containing protein n=1 Tax=Thelephora terrestris TaxID=56493 RepID=A0A9P6H4A7_9AGAM|nr:actin-like ATPase domain-containing protein [Thelephora terrestris]